MARYYSDPNKPPGFWTETLGRAVTHKQQASVVAMIRGRTPLPVIATAETCYQLRATSRKLQATSRKRQATSSETSRSKPQATSNKRQASSRKLQAASSELLHKVYETSLERRGLG